MISISERESTGTLIEDIYGEVRAKQTLSGLRRALRDGEFYCHRCQEFVSLEKRAEHVRMHGLMRIGVAK